MSCGCCVVAFDHENGRCQNTPKSQEIIDAKFRQIGSVDADPDRASHGITNGTKARLNFGPKSVDPATDLARYFLCLANPLS